MRRIVFSVIILAAATLTAHAQQNSEAVFYPATQWYDVNAQGALTLWDVTETGGLELKADPKGGATSLTVASCLTVLENARKERVSVGIGYNPATRAITHCGKPRS